MTAVSTFTPASGSYSYSEGDSSALIASVAKKAAEHIVREKKELVDDFATRFFLQSLESGAVIGKDGQPVKLTPQQKEAWLAEYKEGLLNRFLAEERSRLLESSRRKLEEVEQLDRDIITKQFWSIFHGTAELPKEDYNKVFSTYLADRSLTVEETHEGKSFGRLNSMSSVIAYLKENPLTKTCDFRTFKAEINDIDTLVDFLTTPAAYAVKALAFKTVILEVTKAKLAEAVAARTAAGAVPLKVQYFA